MKKIIYFGWIAFILLSVSGCSFIQKPSVDRALELIDDGKTDQAITMLEKLLEEDEENYDAYLGLYQAYYEEENYRKADKTLAQLSDLLLENYEEEDEDLQDFADALLEAKEELEEDYDKIGSWFYDFMTSPYMSEVESDEEEEVVVEEEEETTEESEFSLEELDANMLLAMTRGEVLSLLGEPDKIDEFESFTEAYYNDEGYSVVYSVSDSSNEAPVKIVGLLEEASVFDVGEKVLAEQYDTYDANYGSNYTSDEYYQKSLFGDGNPIARYHKGDSTYLLMMDASNMVTFAYALDQDSTVSASQMQAEDYIGLTLAELKGYQGEIYFTEPSDGDLIVFFFDSPYYFMFQNTSELSDNSVITSVMLDNGGYTLGYNTLGTATRSQIDALLGTNVTILSDDVASGSLVYEKNGLYTYIEISTTNYPNTIIVTGDSTLFGDFSDSTTTDPTGTTTLSASSGGIEFVGIDVATLKTIFGSSYVYDDSYEYFNYLDYTGVPYSFGFYKEDTFNDQTKISTVFVYFKDGGILTASEPFNDVSLQDFKDYYATSFYGVEYFDEYVYFEDDYYWYTVWWYGEETPTYMQIESKE